MPPPSTILTTRKRKLLPASKPSSSSPSSSRSISPEEIGAGEYKPGISRPESSRNAAPKAIGRQMSREQLRKANHSLIERRRREKINTAFGELRSMVPGLGEGIGKGGEFKLEVLERTVEYMRELKSRMADLEQQSSRRQELQPREVSPSPPTPSLSVERNPVDPDETESEVNRSPPGLKSHSLSLSRANTRSPHKSPHQTPSIAFLLESANRQSPPRNLPTRPPAPPHAANPNLFLPFPAPSPSSPFLNYPSSSNVSTQNGPPEPSPFLAPLQNISLFGGVLNLDQPGLEVRSMAPEDAANVLLAFSSPEVLTPKMGSVTGGRGRNGTMTLEADEFSLDGGLAGKEGLRRKGLCGEKVVVKTARDILRM